MQKKISELYWENGQAKPDSTHLMAIEKFSVAKDVQQIQHFLGVVGHFRNCVQHFEQKLKPLAVLFEKGKHGYGSMLSHDNNQVGQYNMTVLDSLVTMGANKDDDETDENVTKIQLGLNNILNKPLT